MKQGLIHIDKQEADTVRLAASTVQPLACMIPDNDFQLDQI